MAEIYYDVFTNDKTSKDPVMGDLVPTVNGTVTSKTDVSKLKGTEICVNDTLLAMTAGQLVYASSVTLGKYSVKLADKSATATSFIFGVVVTGGLSTADVEIQTIGLIKDIDTSSKTLGQCIYLDTSGGYTFTKPTTGEIKIIGSVYTVDATYGMYLINSTGVCSTAATLVDAATYTVLSSDTKLDVTYTGTGAVTITIPTALITGSFELLIKDGGFNASVNNITVATEGSETIDGEANWKIDGDGDWLEVFTNAAETDLLIKS